MSTDPLQLLYKDNKPNILLIEKIIFGERQVAVLLNNKQLGTCTTLGNQLFAEKENLLNPDFTNISHRALLIAYYSACYNYIGKSERHCDITDIVDFSLYKNVVMIGYFRALAEKIDANHIPLHIFDLENNEERLTDIQWQHEFVAKADAVIITATTLLNNTFGEIVENTNKHCDVFLLGPTSILCQHILNLKNLKYIFGAVFNEYEKVLKIIKEGGGIKDIIPFMQKIYIKMT